MQHGVCRGEYGDLGGVGGGVREKRQMCVSDRAMAVLLVVCRDQPQWRDGVVVTLSMALLGMAVGRLLSWLVDRRLDRYPALFMAIEIVLGLGLLISL